jgi:hypothetical protein
MESEFTLSRLAEIARTPKRAVQLWADAGVIMAKPSTMRAGSGVHRKFSREEVIVGCIVAPFAKQKVAIGALERISVAVRAISQSWDVERTARGQHYLLVRWHEIKPGELLANDFEIIAADGKRDINVFDRFAARDHKGRKPVKVDLISLNEALRDVPVEP